MSGYWLVRRPAAGWTLEEFARATGAHPQFLRRLVALGLLECEIDHTGRYWFPPSELERAARIQRLRAGLGLNYAAVGVVLDLLERIEALEIALRGAQQRHGR